jgi:hypothetical protein
MPEDIGGVDSQSLAAEAAAAAVGSTEPETQPEPENLMDQIAEAAAQQDQDLETTTLEVPTEPEVPEVPTEPTHEEPVYDEFGLELARLGLDLGIDRSELNPELQPMYDKFAQQAILQAQSWQNQQTRLSEAQAEIQQFAQKLQDDPQKVLLTMAVTNPEAFNEAIESYNRMSEDEFYRNTVIKDLQAEAKTAAVERQQRIFQQQMMQQRVAQVTKATHIAADTYGVDHGLAEELVAAAITRSGGDIDISQISGVISRWAPQSRSVSPQVKAERVAKAPTPQSVQGHGSPVGEESSGDDMEISPGLTRANRNPFLDLVRGAAGRLSSSE